MKIRPVRLIDRMFLSEEIIDTDEDEASYCRATFDGWTCWQTVNGGTVSYEVCSEFAYSNQGPSCHRK